MPAVIHALGLIPNHTGLTWWLVRDLTRLAVPGVRQFVEDPSGAVRRIGDVLVWNGPKGREVVSGLESVSESHARIQQVVGNIEQGRIGITAGLGTPTSLSMATLGLGALAAGFMLHRLNALGKRLEGFGNQLADIEAVLGSQNRAHLGTALQHLQFFEDGRLFGHARAARRRDPVEAGDSASVCLSHRQGVVASDRSSSRPCCSRKRRNASWASTSHATAHAMNSVTSTRRLPVSQLWTQLCGFPRRPPRSRWVRLAPSRRVRRYERSRSYSGVCWDFVAMRGDYRRSPP